MRRVPAIVFPVALLLSGVGVKAQSPYYNQATPPQTPQGYYNQYPSQGGQYSDTHTSDYYASPYGGVWECRAQARYAIAALANLNCAVLLSRAERGGVDDQYNLARYYDNKADSRGGCQGGLSECRWAFYWYNRAAQQGHLDAQNKVGYFYLNGYGVKRDYAQAVVWFQKAAQRGYESAEYNLGYMYTNGYGVKQDYALAFTFYRAAANQGDADAQYNCGVAYWNGRGVRQDYTQAVAYFRLAHAQGLADATNDLGIAYYKGLGVPKDVNHALMLFRWAVTRGSSVAQQNVDAIAPGPVQAPASCQGPDYEWRNDGLYGNAANCYRTPQSIQRENCLIHPHDFGC